MHQEELALDHDAAVAETTLERTPGVAARALPPGYRPRSPVDGALHSAVRRNLETLLAEQADRGRGLPRFVEQEFRRYVECGVLAHGFARVHCGSCGNDLLVPFSCKRRGVCPSCTTRRAHDTAAHLVDHVLPAVPLRQWVLTFPRRVRWLFARRPALVRAALDVFLRALFTWMRQRARVLGLVGDAGAVTFIQRFGSALQLNIHLHVVVPDGVFATDEQGGTVFHRIDPPSDEDVERLLRKAATRVLRMIARRVGDDELDTDDALAALEAASLQPAARGPDDALPARRLTSFLEGFSLHAATKVHENDRQGRERLCIYGARGPLANNRLTELPDGRFRYRMKRATHAGATDLVLSGVELLRKLAPLIPPPRVHLTRYHGCFAPTAKLRTGVTGIARQAAPSTPPACAAPVTQTEPASAEAASKPRVPSAYRVPWADLLRRVFDVDVLKCARCGERMKVLAVVHGRGSTQRILLHLGLSADVPVVERARGPPEMSFDW